MPKRSQMLAFRADMALRDRIQAYAARLQDQAPGLKVAQTDVVRDLILRGFQVIEPPKRRR